MNDALRGLARPVKVSKIKLCKGLRETLKGFIKALNGLNKALDGLIKALGNLFKAIDSLNQILKNLVKAPRGLSKDLENLMNDLEGLVNLRFGEALPQNHVFYSTSPTWRRKCRLQKNGSGTMFLYLISKWHQK